MLAQNFKTPADLNIPDLWFESLVKVLGMLERGELVHTPTAEMEVVFAERVTPVAGLFNMNRWSVSFECGTVCCLGGTAEAVGGFRFSTKLPRALDYLFHPGRTSRKILHRAGGYDSITTDQSAMALRSYLTTGEPRWAEALAA